MKERKKKKKKKKFFRAHQAKRSWSILNWRENWTELQAVEHGCITWAKHVPVRSTLNMRIYFALHPQQTHRQYFLCWGYERERKKKKRVRFIHQNHGTVRRRVRMLKNEEQNRGQRIALLLHTWANLICLSYAANSILSYPILSPTLDSSFLCSLLLWRLFKLELLKLTQHSSFSTSVLLLWLPTHQLAGSVCVCVCVLVKKRPQGEKKRGKKWQEKEYEKRERTWKNEPFCSRELVCWQAPSAILSFASPSSSFHSHGSARLKCSSNNNRQIKPGENLLASYNGFSGWKTAAPKER